MIKRVLARLNLLFVLELIQLSHCSEHDNNIYKTIMVFIDLFYSDYGKCYYTFIFISEVLLQIPTAVRQLTETEVI